MGAEMSPTMSPRLSVLDKKCRVSAGIQLDVARTDDRESMDCMLLPTQALAAY